VTTPGARVAKGIGWSAGRAHGNGLGPADPLGEAGKMNRKTMRIILLAAAVALSLGVGSAYEIAAGLAL
jgi:hypothetical protein